jgi:hypothetical protein
MSKRKLPRNTSPKPGHGTGVDGSAAAVAARSSKRDGSDEGREIVERRHSDWAENQMAWRFFLDSYEGGNRYRNAVYGTDRQGLPLRNLIRHRREYPDPQQNTGALSQGFPGASSMLNDGSADVGKNIGPWPGMLGADPSATDQDSVYEMRRSRTPVPEFVSEAVGIALGKLYDQEVDREGPPEIETWWEDVDGKGTNVDDYMRETVAPLLMALGQLDVVLDHPKAPPDEKVVTRADEIRLGLDNCVVSYYLPENVLWWKVDAADRYTEVLVREYVDPSERDDTDDKGDPIDPEGKDKDAENWRKSYIRYRHWTAEESCLYSHDGSEVLERIPHRFGRVPIVRLIDLKKHRTSTVGKCRNEVVCELQRAYYNQLSELILNAILQGHPLLSGPMRFFKADETISTGPNYLLPKYYPEDGPCQDWTYVAPTNDPQAAMRQNLVDIVERIDRAACLTKPAGAAGTGGSTVSQSGVSKQLDATTGHKMLTSIAKSLSRAETTIAEYALLVLRNRPVTPADRKTVTIGYPARFDLNDAATLIDGMTKLQLVMESCGNAPETEGALIGAAVRQLLVGLDDDTYAAINDEIEELVATKSKIKEQNRELDAATTKDTSDYLAGGGSLVAPNDPAGQAGGTAMSGNVMSQ